MESKNSANESENIKISKENFKEPMINKEEKIFCKNCGAELIDNCDFCPKCGKSRMEQKEKKYCSKCGNQVEGDTKYCPKCGGKIITGFEVPDSIKNVGSKVKKKFNLKKGIIVLSIIVVVAILAIVAKNVFPKIFVSTDTLLTEGDYQKAYNKANKEEKENVLRENLIAYLSGDSLSGYKKPESFSLLEAWYNKDNPQVIVFRASGENGYGGTSTSYILYTYNKDEEKYEIFSSVSDLDEEETYSWDDSDDKLEKTFNNLARLSIKNAIKDDNKLPKAMIKRINGLHKKNKLDEVELIDEVKEIYPTGNTDT